VKISIVCSNPAHPVAAYLDEWVERNNRDHDISLVNKKAELTGGDILFLVSCSELISAKDRAAYGASLVLHASDLPSGRGWSPHIWEIASGAAKITLSLLEAEDKVDSGRIWKKVDIAIPDHALWDEINHLLFTAELELMDYAVASYGAIIPLAQAAEVEPTYHRKRTPEDSRIDAQKTIAEQFDLIRVCDPDRFPAFFEYRGQRYTLKLEKTSDE
jgi:methionyl-tRNA formyltransferase